MSIFHNFCVMFVKANLCILFGLITYILCFLLINEFGWIYVHAVVIFQWYFSFVPFENQYNCSEIITLKPDYLACIIILWLIIFDLIFKENCYLTENDYLADTWYSMMQCPYNDFHLLQLSEQFRFSPNFCISNRLTNTF